MVQDRPLYCIVADKKHAKLAKPDLGKYSPKELAAKEGVKPKTVYGWVQAGLPALRHGERGDIQILYQDYVQWMIDCARNPDSKVKGVPVWAYWFIRAQDNAKGPISR